MHKEPCKKCKISQDELSHETKIATDLMLRILWHKNKVLTLKTHYTVLQLDYISVLKMFRMLIWLPIWASCSNSGLFQERKNAWMCQFYRKITVRVHNTRSLGNSNKRIWLTWLWRLCRDSLEICWWALINMSKCAIQWHGSEVS